LGYEVTTEIWVKYIWLPTLSKRFTKKYKLTLWNTTKSQCIFYIKILKYFPIIFFLCFGFIFSRFVLRFIFLQVLRFYWLSMPIWSIYRVELNICHHLLDFGGHFKHLLVPGKQETVSSLTSYLYSRVGWGCNIFPACPFGRNN